VSLVPWLERRQVPLYLASILAGAVVGLTVPGAHRLEVAI